MAASTSPLKPTIDPHLRVFLPMCRAFGQPDRSRIRTLPFLPVPTGLPFLVAPVAPAGGLDAGAEAALRVPGRAARRPGPLSGGCLSLTGLLPVLASVAGQQGQLINRLVKRVGQAGGSSVPYGRGRVSRRPRRSAAAEAACGVRRHRRRRTPRGDSS